MAPLREMSGVIDLMIALLNRLRRLLDNMVEQKGMVSTMTQTDECLLYPRECGKERRVVVCRPYSAELERQEDSPRGDLPRRRLETVRSDTVRIRHGMPLVPGLVPEEMEPRPGGIYEYYALNAQDEEEWD